MDGNLNSQAVPQTPMQLLVITDNQLDQSVIKPWMARVAEEGRWAVEQVVMPYSSGWNDPARANKVGQIREIIRLESPDAVQIIGSVGVPASGFFAPDGHTPRVFWSPVPYTTSQAFSDKIAFVNGETYPVSTNQTGDNRFDQNSVKAEIPVAVIDFGNIDNPLPKQFVQSGKHAGSPVFPVLDGPAATQKYFVRNLAYRTGAIQYPETGLIQGGLYYSADRTKMRADNTRIKSWDERADVISPAVQPKYFLAFHTHAAEHWHKFSDAGYEGSVIENVYRSYGMEYFRTSAQRRRLEWCLASLWGRPGAWVVRDTHLDLYEVFKYRMERNPIFPVSDYVMGDITLPISKPKQEAIICPTCNGRGTVSSSSTLSA